jgi:hypothetical protein
LLILLELGQRNFNMHDYTAYVDERVPLKKHSGEAMLYSKHAYTALVFDDSLMWLTV